MGMGDIWLRNTLFDFLEACFQILCNMDYIYILYLENVQTFHA